MVGPEAVLALCLSPELEEEELEVEEALELAVALAAEVSITWVEAKEFPTARSVEVYGAEPGADTASVLAMVAEQALALA